MDTIKATGATAPFLTGPEIQEELRGGTTTTYSYTGTLNDCQIQRQIAKANGATSISLGPDGTGLWRLSTTFAGLPEDEGGAASEPAVDLHELERSAEVGDFRTNAVLRNQFTGDALYITTKVYDFYKRDGYADSSDYIRQTAAITTAWESQTPEARARLDISRLLTRASLGAQNADCLALFNRLVAGGGDIVYKFNSVYRRTITAASPSQVRAAYTGSGQIWTSGEVEAFEGIPTASWFGLPSTLWLKMPPRVTASAGGKTDIEYSYQGGFDSASSFFYTAYGAASLLD